MRHSVIPRSRQLSEAAERQMRSWALGLQVSKAKAAEPEALKSLIHPYIAISRETGIEAGEIAELIAEKLKWKALDRQVLDDLAEEHKWSRFALECLDERAASWFHDILGKWFDHTLVTQPEYLRGVARVFLLAAQHESMVFVGRGAQFILPRETGVTVRLIAPKRSRIREVMSKHGCAQHDAETKVNDADRARTEFIRSHFHRDIADPLLYDLIINLEHVQRDQAAELIAAACRLRFGKS